MQTSAQIAAIYREWVARVVPTHFPVFLDSQNNANALFKYLTEAGKEYSLDALTQAAVALRHSLESKTSEMIAAEQAAKAQAQQQTQQNEQVVNLWLKRHAPLGLLASNGEPFAGDIDRFIEFVNRNYNGVFSVEALNAAVVMLEPVLTWFSNERELRNVPPPPPRNLSRQAKIDAGMIPVNPDGPQSHLKDAPLVSIEETARQAREHFRKMTGQATEEQEWQNKAEALQVSGRQGKTDWPKTDSLRQVFARNTQTGQIDWKRTFEERYRMAEIVERAKNR